MFSSRSLTAAVDHINDSLYYTDLVLADVDMDWEHGRDEVKLFFSPAGLLVVAPVCFNWATRPLARDTRRVLEVVS